MKNITIYYSCIAVFLLILLSAACESRKQMSLQQLASLAHFKADFPDEEGDSMPIGVYMESESSSTSCINLKYENKEGLYLLADSSEICHKDLENQNVSIYAYAPYRKDIKSSLTNHHIIVSSDQRDSANYIASDFLYANTNSKGTSSNEINLPFKTKFSKIVINIKTFGFLNSENIDFEITNVATSTNINLRTGVLFGSDDISNIKPIRKKKVPSGFNYTLEAILIPQTILGNTPIFKLRIGTKEYSYLTKYDVNVEVSMQYTCNIVVDNSGLHVEAEEYPRTKNCGADNMAAVSERIYKVGDYYPIPDDPLSAIGVVFSIIDNKGVHGKMVSLDEAIDLEWGPFFETGAKSRISGASNKVILSKKVSSLSQYKALSWCLNKGKGWYLPAINELFMIYKQKEILNHVLSTMLRSDNLGSGVYVSSTEYDESKALVLHFGNGERFPQDKSYNFHARAICDF
ncbi:fimbrillin family protein [Dysgonomonas sp. GY617]|uniref:fimbrillin family protein n=1 Tax=Dysgonomonas sp. GY617 TaxID=2780420 RepID=UPI0018845E18|nr:fimbrillin family protein [Dysgonomonas sp. GY617]MBF0577669.1 fimbrillin family protein [Dysgonomonas sp. GY617]